MRGTVKFSSGNVTSNYIRITYQLFTILALLALVVPSNVSAQGGEGDAYVLAQMEKINKRLKARGLNLAIEEIEFFTLDNA